MLKSLLTAGVVLTTVLSSQATLAATFSRVFTFGDSLSDTGNVFGFTNGAIPPESFGFADGRFSNGNNWIDFLTADLGLDPVPTFFDVSTNGANPVNGINFAFGGATTGLENAIGLTFPGLEDLPGLQQQVDVFVNNFGFLADPEALYIVWAGANDYIPNEGSFVPFEQPDVPIGNLGFAINRLVEEAGAQNVLVVNLPDLGSIPFINFRPDAEKFTALVASHNQKLNALVTGFSAEVNATLFDVSSVFAEVVNDPSAFGLTNVTESCLLSGCTNPDEFLFWDTQHPTIVGNRIIADAALATLEESESIPEPGMVLGLMVVATGAIALRRRCAIVK